MKALVRMLAYGSLLAAGLLHFRIYSLWSAALWFVKLIAESLAPLIAVVGAAAALLGLLRRDQRALVAGGMGAAAVWSYVRGVTAPHDGLLRAFGLGWEARIAPQQQAHMLRRRWNWRMPDPPQPPRWTRDVVFWTLPDSGRKLLCDIWQPPFDVKPSGLALVYFHGSGWHYGDKDMGTRHFFAHLAAQGHVIMDVAYRLCPETDLDGMMGDARRALVWIKQNADAYGVNPARVVVAGGSAGAHIALLAAYTPERAALDAPDIGSGDASVCGVVAYYPPADLRAIYDSGQRVYGSDRASTRFITRMLRAGGVLKEGNELITVPVMAVNLLGGAPDECPARYTDGSPISHVRPGVPPTFIVQGTDDWLVPVEQVRALYDALQAAGVPAVYLELPATDHGFDMALPQYSPAAQAALYDLERFLALLV